MVPQEEYFCQLVVCKRLRIVLSLFESTTRQPFPQFFYPLAYELATVKGPPQTVNALSPPLPLPRVRFVENQNRFSSEKERDHDRTVFVFVVFFGD